MAVHIESNSLHGDVCDGTGRALYGWTDRGGGCCV